MLCLAHNGIVYNFARIGYSQEGNWLVKNRIVHLALQQDLTKKAKAAGMVETHNFARHAPKPVRVVEPRVKGPRKSRSANKGRFGVKLKLGQIRVGA